MNESTRPSRDEEEEIGTTEKATAYTPRRARSPLVILLMMTFFAVLAVAGIVTVLTTKTEDPTTIQLPVYTAKSLDETTPPSAEMTPLSHAEDTHERVPDNQELPASRLEEIDQQETPLNLNPDVPQFSPQSMLFTHDKIAMQTPIQYPKAAKPRPPETRVASIAPAVHPSAIQPRPFQGKRPQLVIVIDDMGLNQRNSRRIVALDAALTLAYLPYAERLPQQTEDAYAKGHELIVHMPMEPEKVAQNNPGPNALLTTLSKEQNIERLKKNLAAFDRYIGINNHMGSKMTADAAAMKPVMDILRQRGLWFLDSKTIGHSIASKSAGEAGVPFAVRDVFLDNVQSVTAVAGQLNELERVGRMKGYAIAIGHPHNATVDALAQWLPQARARGFDIVPLSAIITRHFPDAVVPRYARVKQMPKQAAVHETAEKETALSPRS